MLRRPGNDHVMVWQHFLNRLRLIMIKFYRDKWWTMIEWSLNLALESIYNHIKYSKYWKRNSRMQIEHIANTTSSFLNGTHLEIVENKPENHVYIWIQAFENMHKSCVLGPERYFLDLLYTISKFSVLSQPMRSKSATRRNCVGHMPENPPTQSTSERRCYFQFSYGG